MSVDGLDRAILRCLQRDGRLSNVEPAARVRLSPSPCLRRVRHLEQDGVITGYHAQIHPSAVGRGFQVVVHADMTVKDRATIEAFETQICELGEVLECSRMFGFPDYLLRVAVADQAAYQAFYMSKLADLPGVARLNSQMTMTTVKPALVCPSPTPDKAALGGSISWRRPAARWLSGPLRFFSPGFAAIAHGLAGVSGGCPVSTARMLSAARAPMAWRVPIVALPRWGARVTDSRGSNAGCTAGSLV